jgi:monofunctional biosynthetic peptidoglycan transglycosylase
MTTEKSGQSASKLKLVKLISFFFALLISFPLIWLFVLSPRSDISKLKDQFVKTEYSEGQVTYHIVKKNPEQWVSLKSISENSKNAIVISEDWGFFDHKGVDFNQIKKAVQDAQEGKKLRGASTISQQLIKNLFLSSERSYIRKIKEFVLVSHLEKEVSKEKILETYLNIIEFGEGIYGIGAAAKHYFGKKPSQLTAKEGAFLAMLLPNPKKYSSSFRDKKLTPFAKETMTEILNKMAIAGHIKKEDVKRINSQRFNWKKELSAPEKRIQKIKQKTPGKRTGGVKRAKLNRPKSYEDRYRNDNDLQLDDNLEYDDDAILEDTSGLKEEFSVE